MTYSLPNRQPTILGKNPSGKYTIGPTRKTLENDDKIGNGHGSDPLHLVLRAMAESKYIPRKQILASGSIFPFGKKYHGKNDEKLSSDAFLGQLSIFSLGGGIDGYAMQNTH